MAINTSILKSYAPQARRDFITAVKTRAARFGIVNGGAAVIQEQGEVAIINGEAHPRAVARQCRDLESKIALRGFDAVMDEVAYTWFNRFAAIRYMEVHGYLDHGFRVLSHPGGETTPEIVQHADKVALPGLKSGRVVELKLDGRKDEELYRMLLVSQCNALHAAMPFLFERINDETELLLPDNLLHSDSVIRQMVDRIPEADWQEIEIIGWLYQFYISEKKDQVIGKVVKSEDIPAATQLFTPNWIVKYMVQNSLGAKWLATYPDSPIKAKMEYYIEPAEQSEEVLSQIETETPKTLDPETITFLDPASGSGHILVEAYDLFKEIYLERGYRLRDIPRLILEKNVHGLDIDDRAAQLSGFALMMRARADDRRVLSPEQPVLLNVLAMQESRGLDFDEIAAVLCPRGERIGLVAGDELFPGTAAKPTLVVEDTSTDNRNALEELIRLFDGAKTFGTLIEVPARLISALPALKKMVDDVVADDLVGLAQLGHGAQRVSDLIRQAQALTNRYDVVVANPPYMGSGYFSAVLKSGLAQRYNTKRTDLYAIFMERLFLLARDDGRISMVTRQDWLHTSSYEFLRSLALVEKSVQSLVQVGPNAFEGISGEVVQAATFVIRNRAMRNFRTSFVDAREGRGASKARNLSMPAKRFIRSADEFPSRLGRPVLYTLSPETLHTFDHHPPIDDFGALREGIHTGKNAKYVRFWWEISDNNCERSAGDITEFDESSARWAPYNKGGNTTGWYFDTDFVIAFDMLNRQEMSELSGHVRPSQSLYFREGGTWSDVATTGFGVRYFPRGYLFDGAGPVVVSDTLYHDLALMNSKPFRELARIAMPNLHFKCGTLKKMPYVRHSAGEATGRALVQRFVDNATVIETQYGFLLPSLLSVNSHGASIEGTFQAARAGWATSTNEIKHLIEENNRNFIGAFGLGADMEAYEPLENVALDTNPVYRYGPGKSDQELEALLLADNMRDFISYGVGCMVGRYSLDEPGLILANHGNTINDYLAKVPSPTFMPDADNVIPMLDDNWFDDDVTDRFLEFLKVTFGTEHFDENLAFIEKAIGKDIRKFFKREFFSDHLKRYKRRPIYWVFSSGKEKAFEAIVYMHRYNEGTLARMRMNYVVPLQSQMANRIERLATELSGASLSSAERKRKDTQRAKLIKQLEELGRFEEELRHLADQRIQIDLDDGVKVNYGKFGNLLAEIKAVVGKDDD